MTLDIAALRRIAEMQGKDVAQEGEYSWYCAGCSRLHTRCECAEKAFEHLPALLDAAEERDRLRSQRDALLALVERAASDSCVTTSDDPGCFYCDHATHTKRCPAAAAIAAAKEAP